MNDDLVKRLREADVSMKMPDGSVGLVNHIAADRIEQLELIEKAYEQNQQTWSRNIARIEQLEAALKKIASIEDEHINAPRTNAEANLWAILAGCVDLADAALAGEKKDDLL